MPTDCHSARPIRAVSCNVVSARSHQPFSDSVLLWRNFFHDFLVLLHAWTLTVGFVETMANRSEGCHRRHVCRRTVDPPPVVCGWA